MDHSDTIIAQATPPGRSGIGVLRISGLKTRNVAEAILGKLPKPRYANYLSFRGADNTLLDNGIALWFPAPHSFTGEDVLELQSHGSPIVLNLLLKRILSLPDINIRIANPGEFSKRAFLNGKLDLIQAEAIADLINASSEQAVRFALNSLQGAFSSRIHNLIQMLVRLRVYIEGPIDFPDENINFLSDEQIEEQINYLIICLNAVRDEAEQGNFFREGMRVVIAGLPNAGKSSLLNALVGKEVAIVTNIPGTTRDVLREYIHIDGIPLHIIDTAGIRDTNNEIERIGINFAWKEIEHADHVLFIVDGTTTSTIDIKKICPNFTTHLSKNLPITIIRNKSDITGEEIKISNLSDYSLICLSARTGEGIDILRNHLKNKISSHTTIENRFLARHRHIQALEKASVHLQSSKKYLGKSYSDELLAEELRLTQLHLSEITGKFTSDNLLDEIFSSFCIGK